MEQTDSGKLEKLKFYRAEIKQEYDLLAGRVNSYVTSQSFLCIAYASSMGNLNPQWGNIFTLVFPIVLVWLGIATSIQASRGITAAFRTIELWHIKQNKIFENDSALEDYHLIRFNPSDTASPQDLIYVRGLAFAKWSPRIFLAAWGIFGALAVFLHFKS